MMAAAWSKHATCNNEDGGIMFDHTHMIHAYMHKQMGPLTLHNLDLLGVGRHRESHLYPTSEKARMLK